MVGIFSRGLEAKDQKRFIDEIERTIAASNQEVIQKEIPTMTRDTFMALAIHISKIRADYLKVSIDFIKKHEPTQTEINHIQLKRHNYEESKKAFEDLRDAVLKGYIKLS
jgi:hypothetical protein